MKIFCLTETVEREGIRDFNILNVFSDKESAIAEMEKCVKEDAFGDFKNNGFETESETCCESAFNEGFTAYEVVEKELSVQKQWRRDKMDYFDFDISLSKIKDTWKEFGDVPMNPETECIETEWYYFPAGTHREEIWHWFEETFDVSVAEDLMGV